MSRDARLAAARRRGTRTVAPAGCSGGPMAGGAANGGIDHLLDMPPASVHRVQTVRATVDHVLWELFQGAPAAT